MIDDKGPAQQGIIDVRSIVNVTQVHLNVSQELIITTEDKVQLCLSKHLRTVEKRRNWIAPLGVLIPIVVTLVTSTFRDFIIEAATWRAVFILVGVLSFGWLGWSVWEALQSGNVEDIVVELKKGSQIGTTPSERSGG